MMSEIPDSLLARFRSTFSMLYDDTAGAVLKDRHPGVVELIGWLDTRHLPAHLQEVSMPFYDLGLALVARLADGAELTTALRKLLEGKDAAVRQRVKDQREGAAR